MNISSRWEEPRPSWAAAREDIRRETAWTWASDMTGARRASQVQISPRRQPSARTAWSPRKSANCSGERFVIPSRVQGTPAATLRAVGAAAAALRLFSDRSAGAAAAVAAPGTLASVTALPPGAGAGAGTASLARPRRSTSSNGLPTGAAGPAAGAAAAKVAGTGAPFSAAWVTAWPAEARRVTATAAERRDVRTALCWDTKNSWLGGEVGEVVRELPLEGGTALRHTAFDGD
ncbi:hypothetical protein GCM10020254_24130 [Streptomyces goshikiensis]